MLPWNNGHHNKQSRQIASSLAYSLGGYDYSTAEPFGMRHNLTSHPRSYQLFSALGKLGSVPDISVDSDGLHHFFG